MPHRRGTFPPTAGYRVFLVPGHSFSYSGPAAAFAYAYVQPATVKRVFLLGPSHKYYLDGCALSVLRSNPARPYARPPLAAPPAGPCPIDARPRRIPNSIFIIVLGVCPL